jgi:hypothetical protein
MKQNEAYKAAYKGEKIRRAEWPKGDFIIHVGASKEKFIPTPGTPYAFAVGWKSVIIDSHFDYFVASRGAFKVGYGYAMPVDSQWDDWEIC